MIPFLTSSFSSDLIARSVVPPGDVTRARRTLASSLLCLPLYLYFVAPVLFSEMFGFGHPFKDQPSGGLHWDPWAIGGVLTLAVSTYVCLRSFAIGSASFSSRM